MALGLKSGFTQQVSTREINYKNMNFLHKRKAHIKKKGREYEF